MKIGIKASGVLLAGTFGGILLSTQMVLAPPAQAMCAGGQIADPITGICWTQNAPSNSWGGSATSRVYPDGWDCAWVRCRTRRSRAPTCGLCRRPDRRRAAVAGLAARPGSALLGQNAAAP